MNRPRLGTGPVSQPARRLSVLLFGLVIVVLAPSLGIGIVSAYQSAIQQDRLIADRLQDDARALALAVAAEVQTRIHALDVLAASSALDADAGTGTRAAALQRASKALGVPVALLDPDGNEIIYPDPASSAAQPSPLLKEAAQQVAASGEVRLLGAQAGGPAGSVLIPIRREGRVAGILVTNLEGDKLHQILLAQDLPSDTTAALLDAAGHVIAMSDVSRAGQASQPGWQGASQGGSPRNSANDLPAHDMPRLVNIQPVPGTGGWTIAASIPKFHRDAARHRVLLIYLGAGALALAAGIAGSAYVGRKILSPLAELERHARALAERDGEPAGAGARALPSPGLVELEALRQGFAAAEDAVVRRSRAEQTARAALERSEARLRDLLATLDLAPQMVRAMDGTIHYWSAGCERLYGYTQAEAIGRISHDLLRTRFPLALEEIEAVLRKDGSWTGDLLHRTRDGQEIVVTAYKALRHDADGQEVIAEALIDRTGERRTEATLSAVLDALPVGVIIADAQGRLTRDNAANRALWGVPPETASWKEYGDWAGFWPDTGERLKADEWAMARALLRGETVQGELVEAQRFDTGERRFFLNNAAPVRDAAGAIIGGVVAELDVTDARRAEARLTESEAQKRTLIETVPVGLILAELPSGRIISGNRFVETLLRRPILSAPDMFQVDDWTAYHEDGTSVLPEEFPLARIALGQDEHPSVEVQYERGDGTLIWTRMMGRPVRDTRGRLIGGVVAIMDIDIERRARDALTRTTVELEQLVEARTQELRETEARLAQAAKMEALGQLAGGVAHDFNNVLQVIRGSADMMTRRFGEDPNQARTLLSMITESANRGMDVIGRLLAFARRSELSPDRIAPKAMLAGLAEMLRTTLDPRVTLVVDADRVPDLLADRGQLETVIVNLVNNARDALPQAGGVVTLRASLAEHPPPQLPQQRYVQMSVLDTGGGMPPDVLARVSEPFFTTKPRGKGTGLGLAMARGFAEQSGGSLTIESQVGSGTTVSLWLPVAPDDADAVPAAESRTAAAPGARSRATVLLVDDDPAVRTVLATILDDQGHTVVQASNAAMALGRLDANDRVEVLVTDLSMPGDLDGIGLVQAARMRRPNLPAVLITGHLTSNDMPLLSAAAASGPFTALRKPVPSSTLLTTIDTVLRRQRAVG